MSRPDSPRMRKVNELLREVIAEAVIELKDPGLGFLTITGVDATPDLRTAVVYYSVLGTDEEVAETGAAFDRAAPHIQSIAGSQIRMKYTPKLKFKLDPSISEGLKIDQLLYELEDGSEEPHATD